MAFVIIDRYTSQHAQGIAPLCRQVGWPTYSDPDVVERGCTAPGVITRVAITDDEQRNAWRRRPRRP